MANICRTEVKIQGTEDAIKYFVSRYENCNDKEYPNTQDCLLYTSDAADE